MRRRARIFVPTLAAGMIALSLARLGFLHPLAAVALFVLLFLFVLGTAARRIKHGED